MPQEFLASFAVDIDEGGVTRLQAILDQNRTLAGELAAAFDAARFSMLSFVQSASEELTALPFFSRGSSVEETLGSAGSFSIELDFSKTDKQLETFLAKAKKPIQLSANASQIVSAASSAIATARDLVENTVLTLRVKEELDTSEVDAATGGSGSSGSTKFLATGGRYSTPTCAEIAEDGNPEYVVPVRKENEAVPLIRSLLSELSASARESLRGALPFSDASPGRHSERREESPFSDLSAIPDLFSAAPAASAPVILSPAPQTNVQAPVNIRVEASAADPEAVGRSIYDTAERYLLRTLQTVS